MEWYYAIGADRKGPVGEAEFQLLAQQGVITSKTLVWREGMANWQPHGGGSSPPISAHPTSGGGTCSGCGKNFPSTEIISLAGGVYCAACKPLALQRLREGAPTNSAAEQIRTEHLKHEASVKSIGLLYYLGGVGVTLAAIVTLSMIDQGQGGALAVGPAIFLILLGIFQFWAGTGLRRLRPWARIPTGILSVIGLIGFPLGTIINGYILFLVFGKKGKMVFSEEYRAVIEQTPHIKYRTSIVVWVLLGLVLLFIAIALLGAFFSRR